MKDKKQNLMQADARAALEELRSGRSAWQVSRDILVRALPEKDEAQCGAMAERMERAVQRFEQMKERAFAEPEGWLNAQTEALFANESDGAQLRQAMRDEICCETLSAEFVQQLAQGEPVENGEAFAGVASRDRCTVLTALACAQDSSVQPEIAAAAVCYGDAAQDVLLRYSSAEAPTWLHILAQVAVCAALVGLYLLAESVLIPLVLPTGTIAIEQSIMNVVRLGIIVSYIHWGAHNVDEAVDALWEMCTKNKKQAAAAQQNLAAALEERAVAHEVQEDNLILE